MATSSARLTPLNVASYNYKSILYILFRFLSNETSVSNSNSSKQLHVSHLTHIKLLADSEKPHVTLPCFCPNVEYFVDNFVKTEQLYDKWFSVLVTGFTLNP
jgi:hypothetical protein